MIGGERQYSLVSLFFTCFLGLYFLFIQCTEYLSADFCFSDSVYGRVFFLLTGFHGFHVLVGVLFLLVCFSRIVNFHTRASQLTGFEFAIWYWHFVDVVWLFLYCFVYWWGG